MDWESWRFGSKFFDYIKFAKALKLPEKCSQKIVLFFLNVHRGYLYDFRLRSWILMSICHLYDEKIDKLKHLFKLHKKLPVQQVK